MARGEWIGAIAMTEPSAGSDLAGMKTTAVEQPDGVCVCLLRVCLRCADFGGFRVQ